MDGDREMIEPFMLFCVIVMSGVAVVLSAFVCGIFILEAHTTVKGVIMIGGAIIYASISLWLIGVGGLQELVFVVNLNIILILAWWAGERNETRV